MKKVFSIVLILALVLSMGIPAFADQDSSKGLETAILQAKAIIDIPESYTEFSYWTETNRYTDSTLWSLEWYAPDGSGNINATIDESGNLCHMYTWEKRTEEQGFLAKVNRSQAKVTAEAFLKKAMPAYDGGMKEINEAESKRQTYSHVFTYMYFVNDIPVQPIAIYIEVDKYTGKIISFSGLSGQPYPEFEAAEGLITEADAAKAWLAEDMLRLEYRSWFDYDNQTMKAFPAYVGTSGYYVDAQTGEVLKAVSQWDLDSGGASNDSAASAPEAAPEEGLTPEEMEAVTGISGLISQKEAHQNVTAKVPDIKASEKVKHASLTNLYYDKEKYQWSLNFENAHATVDAKTGQLMNFRLHNGYEKKLFGGLMDAESAKVAAENFARSAAPDQLQNCVFDESVMEGIGQDDVTVTFTFERMVNGTPFPGNYVSVTVNRSTRKIIHYACNWYDNAEFAGNEGVMTPEESFGYMDQTADFALTYVNRGGEAYELVYSFMDGTGYIMLDPFTGQQVLYDGSPALDTSRPEYTDLEGHWAKTIVETLVENGYYPAAGGDTFAPNAKITQEEFLRYLYGGKAAGYNSEDFYERMKSQNVIQEDEISPDSPVARQDAAKYVIRLMGFEKAAAAADIYKNPFKDKIAKEYQGYVSLCYGLDIMQGNHKGRFNATAQLTNAEAASIVYNYLQQN